MHEKLNEQIDAMDEKVAKMVEAAIVRLESTVTKTESPNGNELVAAVGLMKDIGTALKVLADGLESYRAVTSAIEHDAKPPKKMTYEVPH